MPKAYPIAQATLAEPEARSRHCKAADARLFVGADSVSESAEQAGAGA